MKDSNFNKDIEANPRIVKRGGLYVFVDSNPLRKKVNAKINELNENSTLPAALLSEYDPVKSSLLFTGSTPLDNYMSFDFLTEDYFVSFFGYPTDEDKHRITRISLLSDKYKMYGIYVGTRVDVANNILKSFGFTKTEYNDTECYCFPGIRIYISASNGLLNQITIDIETYYVGNYLY